MKNTDPEYKHKRGKIIRLDRSLVLEQACSIVHEKPSSQFRCLPEDIEVLGIYYEHEWQAFCLHVCSIEWPIVKEGNILQFAEFEIVHAPKKRTQYTLWRKICDGVLYKQKAIKTANALKTVEKGVEEDAE